MPTKKTKISHWIWSKIKDSEPETWISVTINEEEDQHVMTRVQGPAQVMCRVYSDHCPVTSGDHETWSVEDSSGEGGDQHMRGRDTQGHPGHSSCEVSSSLRVLMWSLKVMELNYIWDCVTPACTSHHWSSHFSNNIWHFKKYFSPFFSTKKSILLKFSHKIHLWH